MIKEVSISTPSKICTIDITSKIESVIREGRTKEGVCRVFVPHTTAGILINEHADPCVIDDILMKLDKMAPLSDNYSHSEGNSSAHIKSSLVGYGIEIFIENSSLKLGTWQGIFFCEFDGPRKRKVWVKIS